MSVRMINITGNLKGFENQLAHDLAQAIKSPCEPPVEIRGEDFIRQAIPAGSHYEVIVIIAHAGSNQSNTSIDTGLRSKDYPDVVNRQLGSPDMVAQFIKGNLVPYFLVYCACSALSPQTITAHDIDLYCKGTVASYKKSVSSADIPQIATIVDFLHGAGQTLDDMDIQKEVAKITASYPDGAHFIYFPVPRVEEMTEED